MNNGPNVVGLIVIGVTAGVSAFSLYLGYKHIKKTRNESNRDEVNVDLNNITFDAEKTLNTHRNNNNSANNSTEKEDIFKNIGKNIGKLLFKNKDKKKQLKSSKKSSKKSSEKKPTKLEQKNIETAHPIISAVPLRKVSSNLAIINEVDNDKLPNIMNKKKLSTSNEDIDTLLDIPNMDEEAQDAQILIDNESIRTIDKVNLKKKKRKKKRTKEEKKLSANIDIKKV